MKERPAIHKVAFLEAWGKAVNRFTREFTEILCAEDGGIKWEALVEFNGGKERPTKPKKTNTAD